MRTIKFLVCFLFAFSVCAQEKEVVSDSNPPLSIFVPNPLTYQQSTNTNPDFLQLKDYKFMIADDYLYFGHQLNVETRNIGRTVSNDDLMDNYAKANLYKFDVNKNRGHFIWNMWDLSLQKEYHKVKINNKKN